MSDTHDANEVLSRVLDLVEEVSGEDGLGSHLDDDLFSLGFLDFMAAIELLVGLEEEFGVSIAPTELPREDMNTVGKIATQVAARM